MKRYFWDLTPILQTPDGRPIRLGVTRYELVEDLVGELFEGTNFNGFIGEPFRGVGYNSSWAYQMEARLSFADNPQPTTVPQVNKFEVPKPALSRYILETVYGKARK